MNSSRAYMEETSLVNWRTNMASLNEDAIKLLNDYQNKVNELNEYMKGNVAEGFINDETATIKENIAFHNNMKDMEKFISLVIDKMNNY